MKNINIILFVLTLLIIGVSCDSEDDLIEERKADNPPVPGPGPEASEAGSANFSTYISIGNSLTAGLMDATLYTRGQKNSYPNLLANKFSSAGGGEFNQPDIKSDNGFNTSYNDLDNAFEGPATFGKLVLDTSIPGPVPTTPGDVMNKIPMDQRSSINNLGVPGMRMIELPVVGYGMLNPFYTRFALDPASTSVLEQAMAKQPTFITFWLGSNDVLAWASTGGTAPDGQDESGNPNGNDENPDALVSEYSFNNTIEGSLQTMFGTYPDLQGVIINIPNITLLPYFQAVPYNSIPMDATTATATNQAYAGYNTFLDNLVLQGFMTAEEAGYRKISFTEGNNAVVVTDDELTDITPYVEGAYAGMQISEEERTALLMLAQARQLKSAEQETALAPFGLPSEILTLPSGAVLGTLANPENPSSVIGVGVPLGDEYTLTADEIAKVLTRTTMFNATIAAQAGMYDNLYLFDSNTFFTQIAVSGGYTIEKGFTYAPDFSPNGIFSVDGIHPNPVGQAIISNKIMEIIETNFGASLPAYDPSEFSTVLTAM